MKRRAIRLAALAIALLNGNGLITACVVTIINDTKEVIQIRDINSQTGKEEIHILNIADPKTGEADILKVGEAHRRPEFYLQISVGGDFQDRYHVKQIACAVGNDDKLILPVSALLQGPKALETGAIDNRFFTIEDYPARHHSGIYSGE